MYETDTWYTSVKYHNGNKYFQIYCGKGRNFIQLYGMNNESQIPGTLMDFIIIFGDMKELFSDNSRVQIGHSVRDILRLYNIKYMKSEPECHHRNA